MKVVLEIYQAELIHCCPWRDVENVAQMLTKFVPGIHMQSKHKFS